MDKKSFLILLIILIGGMFLGYHGDFYTPWEKKETVNNTVSKVPEPVKSSETQKQSRSYIPKQSFADTVEKIKPAVVNVSAVHVIEVRSPFEQFRFGDPFEDFYERFFGMPRQREEESSPRKREYRQEGTGSGFIVTSDGYVLTNAHVVREAEEIKVTTYDDERYDAKVVGADSRTDLAVVKIKSSRKFDVLEMGDSEDMNIGDWVIAAGSPFGLQQTYTAGIISALRQDIEIQNSTYRDMFQTDAAINRGNSGGPLVNLDGKAIGINTAIFAPTGVFSGVGFASPINRAKEILDDLIEEGKVVRGWLGVEIREVDEVVEEHFDLEVREGVLINNVFEDSAADKGGLQRGDIIVKFNDKPASDVRSLQKFVSSADPGQEVQLTVIRDGEEKVIEVELEEMPEKMPTDRGNKPAVKEEITADWKGLEVSNITSMVKEQFDIEADKGVVVSEIDPSKEGYEIGLRVGDVIRGINKESIETVEDFEKATDKVDLSEGIVLDIIRRGQPLYITYKSN
ncbi:MAG: Do family serine endopeptidase [Elusimicrobiota bacterium]